MAAATTSPPVAAVVTSSTEDELHQVFKSASPGASTQTFHVGTRKSILARVQANEVVRDLRAAWPEHHFEIHAMSTTGDNNQRTALHKFNEKSLWTQELEVLLQDRQLDLIVHSLKDMPTQLPADLVLGAVTKREDPRDAFVLKASLDGKYKSLADLPEGSVVGTSSLRRSAQLKRAYPQLRFADVRGNIGTRLSKLDDPTSEYTAIVIAVAGLQRLGMTSRITTYLSKADGGMLHAVGQGALGIETRRDDERTTKLLSKIECMRTARAVLAERSLMRTLEGGCSVPIGVETEWVPKKSSLETEVGIGSKPAESYHNLSGIAQSSSENASSQDDDDLTDELIMRAIVVSLDGQDAAETETRRRITNSQDAHDFGFEAAKLLVREGADKILAQVQLNRGIIKEQGNA